MKTFRLSLILLLLIGAFSCKKVDNSSTSGVVTTDQVADIAAGSLATNSEGLATVADDISVSALSFNSVSSNGQAINTVSAHQACGSTVTDSLTRTATTDSVTVNYFFKYSRTLNCNTNSQPDNLANALTYTGSFNGPRLTSSNSGSSTFTIAGLTTAASNFVVNGEYKRTGQFQSKVGNKASGSSNVDIVVTNLTLSKPGRKILSGSATIAITGTTSKSGAFSYTGTIVFNGDGSATLTINGTVYNINLATGFKVKH